LRITTLGLVVDSKGRAKLAAAGTKVDLGSGELASALFEATVGP
jgi:hypothetical protein